MAEPALRKDIVKVLLDEGVAVEETDQPDYFRMSRGSVVTVKRMRETVSSTTVASLSRGFVIPKSRFYPPRGVVVAMDRAKASGETE